MHLGDKSVVNKKENGLSSGSSAKIIVLNEMTNDLTAIVKLLQTQLYDITNHREKMIAVPSSLLKPKTKEFFKEPMYKTLSVLSGSAPSSASSKRSAHSASNTNKSSNKPDSKTSISSTKSKTSSKVTPKLAPQKSSISGSRSNYGSNFRSLTSPSLISKNASQSSKPESITRKFSATSSRYLNQPDTLSVLKIEVQQAIRDRRTFTIRGHYSAVRRALLERGWVERFHAGYKEQINEELKRYPTLSIQELLDLSHKQNLAGTCKNLIKSKLLGAHQVDFYWGVNDESFKDNPDRIKLTIINKLKRDIFSYTTKQGLCEANKLCHWFQQEKVSRLSHPRSYTLGKNGELKQFVDDFHITAAMSLLKWIIQTDKTKETKLISPCGKIPLEVYDFALNECCKFIKKLKHEDIDAELREASDIEWNQFLDYYYKIVHYPNHFNQGATNGRNKLVTKETMVAKSKYTIKTLQELYEYVDSDGYMNIWMLKPVASSRGRGIHICRTLAYMMKVTKSKQASRFVVQKYIERPLLIHNTKFDIRQWFLISNTTPLTIWMYKECYLRFSSQTYNLRKLHESIHLTNNAVQAKYKNTSIDAALPSYNMWDSNDFRKYLTSIGYQNVYTDTIYPKMKENITAAVLMHQDKMVIRRNCFELYGADFILTEDFQPWLLEINSNPALYSSTPITARMCPKVLEDVVKVVIDNARNCRAQTGNFEQIYKEKQYKMPPPPGDLILSGCTLPPNYFYTPELLHLNINSNMTKTPAPVIEPVPSFGTNTSSDDILKEHGRNIKKTLENLLEIIRKERIRSTVKHHKQVMCALGRKEISI